MHACYLKQIIMPLRMKVVTWSVSFGKYKVKNDRMRQLHSSVMFELNQMDNWSVAHVRREKNTRADALSKNGMQKARDSK